MQECRAKLISHYAVPLLYTWQNIVTFNKFPDAAEVPTEVEA
jgi:hypothetical protein